MSFALRSNHHDHRAKILAGIIASIKQPSNASSLNESERKFVSYRDDVFASINSASSINSHLRSTGIQLASENAVKQFENDPGRNVGCCFRRLADRKINTNS